MRKRGRENGEAPARTRRARWWVLAATAVAGMLAPEATAGQSLQPAGWDAGVRLAEAVDRNPDPDPDVVELDFETRVATVEIAPGLEVEAWTYNGTIPGR